MRILIVMNGGFDTYGPSRHLYDSLIEDFLKNGHSVHLIESHSSGADPDCPEKFVGNKHFTYETINKKVVKKRRFVSRYLNDFFYVLKCKKRFKKNRYNHDIVLIQSLVCAPFMVPAAKKYLQGIIVWNIQDMFPGASIANGVMKNGFLKSFFYRLHKRAYKKADWITVISEDMKSKVIQQGFDEKRITVISDWFDDSSVKEIPWEENRFVKKYKLKKDDFIVQYAGTTGFNFDYKMVMKVAERLTKEKNIIFQIVGFGSQYDIFKRASEEKNLDNIVFLPIEKQEMVPHVYSACSLCFIPLPQGVIGNSVPSKAGLLMACKRPIITTADSDSLYLKMINDNKIGYGFGTSEYEKVADAILYLSKNKSYAKELGLNGYQYGKVIFSRTFNTNKYIELFKKLISKEK